MDDEASPSVHAPIPPILHGIVASSMEPSRNFSPAFPHLRNQALDLKAFFRTDRFMVQ
jgi:hypothetical protein